LKLRSTASRADKSAKSIKGPAERLFLLPDENYYSVNERFAKYAARSPDEEIGVFDVLDIGREVHDIRLAFASLLRRTHELLDAN